MDYFEYYSRGTNHDGHDDVAICEAESLADAILKFKGVYVKVSDAEVKKIELHRNGIVPGIMFVSDY